MEWKKTKLITLVCSIFMLPHSAFALKDAVPSTVQVSRYAHIDMHPPRNQRNIMVSVIDETFGEEVHTVGEAINTLVKKYGYSIGHGHGIDRSQYYLLNLPLPQTHREFSPFPLISTLALLGGEGFAVEVNPVRREVTYRLADEYNGSFTEEEIDNAASLWFSHYPMDKKRLAPSQETCNEEDVSFYGPVAPGETLFTIARSLERPTLTSAQIMMSIFRHNPKSFLRGNINYLLQGTHLNIPSQVAMSAMPKDYARQRMMEHYARWKSD